MIAATVPGERVVVLDADGLGWEKEDTAEALSAVRPRLVGMTVNSYTLSLVEEYASLARAAGAEVIVGGPHASLAPLDFFKNCQSVRYVVRVYVEMIFPELI